MNTPPTRAERIFHKRRTQGTNCCKHWNSKFRQWEKDNIGYVLGRIKRDHLLGLRRKLGR